MGSLYLHPWIESSKTRFEAVGGIICWAVSGKILAKYQRNFNNRGRTTGRVFIFTPPQLQPAGKGQRKGLLLAMLKYSLIAVVLVTNIASAQFGMYLAEKPKISLEDALPIATKAARAKIPDLDKFVLQSIKPRALKNDPKGQHWQFLWQELPFKTHLRGIIVRVYMKDSSTTVEEFQE